MMRLLQHKLSFPPAGTQEDISKEVAWALA